MLRVPTSSPAAHPPGRFACSVRTRRAGEFGSARGCELHTGTLEHSVASGAGATKPGAGGGGSGGGAALPLCVASMSCWSSISQACRVWTDPPSLQTFPPRLPVAENRCRRRHVQWHAAGGGPPQGPHPQHPHPLPGVHNDGARWRLTLSVVVGCTARTLASASAAGCLQRY